MLSAKVKAEIATKVQEILQSVNNDELPNGEINFLLHVDGAASWSWANIRNNSRYNYDAPDCLIGNETA